MQREGNIILAASHVAPSGSSDFPLLRPLAADRSSGIFIKDQPVKECFFIGKVSCKRSAVKYVHIIMHFVAHAYTHIFSTQKTIILYYSSY